MAADSSLPPNISASLSTSSSCSSGGGSGLGARSKDGGGFFTSSEHFSELINIFLASADVWIGKVESVFEEVKNP